MQKRKSLILTLLLVLITAFTAFFIAQNKKVVSASSDESVAFAGDIMDFTVERPYAVSQNLTAVPKTFEALINVNATTKLSNGTWGVVMGNFYDNNAANNDCFNIMIEANGNPRFYWANPNSNTTNASGSKIGFNWVVTNVSLNTAEWNHIAFVRDTANDKTYFYLNGELTATYNDAGDDLIPGSWGSGCGPIKIGMDSRWCSNLTHNFQGKLAYASLSATIKNQEQIKDSMQKMFAGTITQNQNDTAFNTVLYNVDHSYYRGVKEFTDTPNTITATIKLPENYSMVKGGVIIGNYCDGQSNESFNLEVNANGHLNLMWNKSKNGADYSNAELQYEFTSTDLRNGEWTNIALVRDTVANVFRLYINGVLVETSAHGVGSDIIGTYEPVLGNDNRISGHDRNVFAGYIKDCAVFSTALTQNEIVEFYNTADKTQVSKIDYSSMMLNWVLSDSQSTLFYVPGDRQGLTDYSGNENHARLATSQHYYSPEGEESGDNWFTAEDGEYTIIIMPDTQCTMQTDITNYSDQPHLYNSVADFDMTKTFQWMVDNKDAMNLSFVLHMGDLKQSRGVNNDWSWGPEWQNDWREWQLISGYTAMNEDFRTGATLPANIGFSESFINGQSYGFGLLRDAGIPYSAIPGNHDYDDFNMGLGTGRNADYFNYYFSSSMYDEAFPGVVVSRYSNNTPEFAKNNDTMMNVIYEMDATPKGSKTPVKYLVVSFEFGPDDDMLAWADSIVSQEKYANHRVIVNTHAFLYADGNFMSDNAYCNPTDYAWYNTPGVIGANNSQEIYDKLVSKHGNMFLTSGGHTGEESMFYRTDVADFGNTVYSMLVDYQGMYDAGGDSLIVVAKVNENTKKITFRTYNPVTNKFYNVENEIDYDFSGWEADKHTVTWKNGNNTLETDNIVGGIYPDYNGAIPQKSSGYTFAGWSTTENGPAVLEKDLPIVTKDVTYYAIFAQTQQSYTITWNVNGATTTTTVNGGDLPVFTGSTYRSGYVFTGWDKQIAVATQNTVYTAQYSTTSVWDGKFPTSGVIGDYLSGAGTQADPYLIEDASDLAALSYFSWGKTYGTGLYFKQMVNLDMTNGVWIGICDSNNGTSGWVATNNTTYGFDGVYDGNGKTISLNETRDDNHVALFWAIKNGTVKNLILDGSIFAGSYSGILAVRICGSATISGITSNVDLTKGSSGDANAYAGLIGFIANGITATINISDCYNNGTIWTGGNYVGGIIGVVGKPTSLTLNLTNCHNTGDITGVTNVGGLIGMVSSLTKCNITGCSNSGKVNGKNNVAGIVGNCNWDVNMAITNTNNSGNITASTSHAGGIITYMHRGGNYINNKVENCASTGTVRAAGVTATNKYGYRGTYAGNIIGCFGGDVTVVWSINGNNSATSKLYAGGSGNETQGALLKPVYTGTTPTKSGYSFVGWSLTDGGEVIYGELPYAVEDTTTFYAVFVSNTNTSLSVWDGKYPTSGVITDYLSGAGTQASPYLIESASDLAALSYFSWSKSDGFGSGLYFKQTVDIILGTGNWIGICDSNGAVDGWVNLDVNVYGFDGVYDGNGKSITINQSSGNNFGGLFWAIKGGTVKNLTLHGNITAGSYSGTLTARISGSATISGITNNINLTKISTSTDPNNFFGMIGVIGKNIFATVTITDCVNNGNIVGLGNHTGGFIGGVYESAVALVIKFTDCINRGNVSSGYYKKDNVEYGSYVGGLIGKTTAKTTCNVTNCSNFGNIFAEINYAGGLIGCAIADSVTNIIESDNQGNISGDAYVGGLVGACDWNVNISITDCENTGSVTAIYNYAGGIISYVHRGGIYLNNIVENCTSTGIVKASGTIANAKYGKQEKFSGNIIGRYDGMVTVVWSINGDTSNTSTIYPGGANNDVNSRFPTYSGVTPIKPDDGNYKYTFAGWALTEGGEVIIGNLPFAVEDLTTFYAVFTATNKNYEITWVVNGLSSTVLLGVDAKPVYGSIPTKNATAEFTYTFAGWATTENGTPMAESELPNITQNATYYAIFTQTVKTYTITWIVDGQTTTEQVAYGALPTYNGTPIKNADSQYTYEFSGWSPEVTQVTGNATYTAQFNATPIETPNSSSSIEDSSSSVENGSSSVVDSSSTSSTVDSSGSVSDIPEQSGGSSSSGKGGCGSSIGHASALLVLLAILSACVILKKKHD